MGCLSGGIHGTVSFRAIMVPTLELDRTELIYSQYSTLMNFTVRHEFGRAGGMESGARREESTDTQIVHIMLSSWLF